MNSPMRMFREDLEGLGEFACVPEFDPAVVPTGCQEVLLVGVEIYVSDQLAVGRLYLPGLTGGGVEVV